MNKNSFAVFIGVDTCFDPVIPRLLYAEKDCRDLEALLTHPRTGTFLPQNSTLLTGTAATTKAVKRLLQRIVVDRSAEDMVLVYFSGHGIVRDIGDRKRTYFGTYDLSIEDITAFPHEGLDLDFLHNDMFLATPAHTVVLILDCCHSGAIVPASLRDGHRQSELTHRTGAQPMLESMSHAFSMVGKGRIVIVACPAEAVSREDPRLGNGIFTHWMLKGLRGEAVDGESEEVTIDSLLGYLRKRVPADQPPGRYGHDYGRIVLARPLLGRTGLPGILITRTRVSPAAVYSSTEPSSLVHPLEVFQDFVRKVSDQIGEVEAEPAADYAGSRLLDAIRQASGGELAFFLRAEDEGLILGARSPSHRASAEFERIASLIPSELIAKYSTRRSNHGFSISYRLGRRAPRSLIVIPTSFEPRSDLLVVAGLDSETQLSDAFGTVLAATVAARRRIIEGATVQLEAAVLDDLKRTYGFIPKSMYQRRQQLFRSRLATTTVYFQPVVYISRKNIGIDSWEALARDRETGRAPRDLFDAAELWGQEFMGELDRYFLFEETKIFRSAIETSQLGSAPELSINVYPRSLMGEEYYDAMKEVLDSGVIVPEKLVLEISEKVPLYRLKLNDSEEEGLIVFKARLEEFVKEFQVGFAIDDFGIRQASVSNLARLHPDLVKIDRDALLHGFGKAVIRFVVDLTRTGRLRHTKVVVEGFDAESCISLVDIYNLGVRHVQGFKLGDPEPLPYQLSDSRIHEIRRWLAEEQD